MGWFLYDNGLRHERVKSYSNFLCSLINYVTQTFEHQHTVTPRYAHVRLRVREFQCVIFRSFGLRNFRMIPLSFQELNQLLQHGTKELALLREKNAELQKKLQVRCLFK